MEFLDLFNKIAVLSNPALAARALPDSMGTFIKDTDIDSLDVVMVSVYLCDAFGIAEEVGKTMPLETPQRVFDFIQANKTKDPESYEAALEAMK